MTVLKKSFYVDDLVASDATVERTIELHGKAKKRLAEGDQIEKMVEQ